MLRAVVVSFSETEGCQDSADRVIESVKSVIRSIAVSSAERTPQLPEVPIREGASMMARVASRGDTHAVLVIAGLPVTAELPPGVQAGATLKLKVMEVTAERVWLQIEPQQPTTPTMSMGWPIRMIRVGRIAMIIR